MVDLVFIVLVRIDLLCGIVAESGSQSSRNPFASGNKSICG